MSLNLRSTRAIEPKSEKQKLTVRELVILGLIAAFMVAGQVVLAALPNVEIVSLILIACSVVYGWRTLYPLYTFVLVEALIYGFSTWVINYLYVWPVLVVVSVLLRRSSSRFLWAAVSGGFGLFFGALCAILYLFIGGPEMMVAYWISGIPFDLIHCISNGVIAFLLVPPLVTLLRRLSGQQLPEA